MEKKMFASAGSGRSEVQGYFAAVGEWFAELGARAARARAARQTLYELARLDDRALKDIGLHRSDIEAAECVSPRNDPVALLRSRRQARCSARAADRYY